MLLCFSFVLFLCSAYSYCKFENFRKDFIFLTSIERHIFHIQNLRLRKDLPISVNDRVISPFHKGFIFTKLHICEVL